MTRTNDRQAHTALVATAHDETKRQRENADAISRAALGKLAKSTTAPRSIVQRVRAFFKGNK